MGKNSEQLEQFLQKSVLLLLIVSLIINRTIEAIIIIEAPKNNQVFLDSILKFEKSKFNIFNTIAIITSTDGKFRLIIFYCFFLNQ